MVERSGAQAEVERGNSQKRLLRSHHNIGVDQERYRLNSARNAVPATQKRQGKKQEKNGRKVEVREIEGEKRR